MKKILPFFCLLINLGNLQAQPVVSWYVSDLFPLVILQGPLKGQGALDYSMEKIKSSLKDYIHIQIIAPVSRFLEDAKVKKLVIRPTIIRSPDRERYLYFSKPYVLFRPTGLLMLREVPTPIKSFISSGKLDLEKALQSPSFKLGIIADRNYGDPMDNLIEKASENSLVRGVAQDKDQSRLILMLYNNRLSAIVGYEEELLYLANELKLPLSQFQFMPIKGSEPYVLGHFSTALTPEGKLLMDKIDSLIPDIIYPTALAYEHWMTKDAATEHLRLTKEVLSFLNTSTVSFSPQPCLYVKNLVI